MMKKLRYFCTLLLMAVVSVAWADDVTDVLNQTWTGVSGTSYAEKTGLQGSASNAVYSVQCAGGNDAIQLRSSNSNSGIVSTTSGGTVTKVTVTWNSNTVSGRKLNVYGSNSAYSAPSDLYGSNAGTLIGTIECGTSTELTISGNYTYIGLRSASSAMYLDEIKVTWSTGGGSGSTTYTVTYDGNGGEGAMTDPNSPYEENDEVTLLENTFTAPEGMLWDSWEVKDADDNVITVTNGKFTMPANNVTVKAQWVDDPNAPQINWVLTNLADLTANDVFVIVGNNGSNYAMTNNNGTSNPPAATAVTVANNKITSTVAANIQWTVSGNATDGYTFYPNGSTSTWLYCNTEAATSSNNNMRVGTGNRKVFELNSSNFLLTKDDKTTRYLSIYNNQDWRGYINTNLSPEISFYKKVTGGVLPPSISADNVNIAYDATGGEIVYTINNPVEGGSVNASTTADWLTIGTNLESPIAFTCDANTVNTARTATVTLTYSYGNNETVTKDVTVTQAAAPVIYTTIPELFAAATSTATNVTITFNNWVISAVKDKNAYLTDNQGNGLIIYQNGHGFNVNDVLSGTTSCNLVTYQGSAELTGLTATTEGLTVTSGGTVTEQNIAINDLGGVNTGALVHYDGLTYDGTNLVDGNNNSIKPYSTLYSYTFENGKTYNVTGIYLQYNTTKELLPRSANDVEEIVSENPTIEVSQTAVNVGVEGDTGILTVQYQNIDDVVADIQFYDATGAPVDANYYEVWLSASLDEDNNVSYIAIENYGEARTAYFKVYALVGNDYVYSDMITITQAAYLPKYIVNFNTDGGTFVPNDVFTDDIVEIEKGKYALPSATKDGFKLQGWNDGNMEYAAGSEYDFTADVDFTAVWVEKGNEEWVLTDITELTADDVFVIVGNNGSDFAMPNDNGTSSAPTAVAVTVENNKITSVVNDNMMWNVSGNATDGYTFYVNGDSEKWLYCTNSNNGVRVGTNDSKTFKISDGYLKHDGTSRYVGVYNSQDWRCYTSNTGNSNIKDQTFAFYKKVETIPATTATITIRSGFTATTFSCDKALDFTGQNIAAYIITDENGATTQVTKVPANTGLYIVGAEGDYEVSVLADATEAEDMTGNLLVGTISDPVNTKTLEGNYTYYLFGKQNGKEAFFKVGESTSDAKATASAGKAYLAIAGANNAKEMIVIGGDVTAIDNLQQTIDNSGAVYNLQGQRVQAVRKGVYIVNGRKVVIK